MSIQVIVPTIAGREEACAWCVEAYKHQGAEVLLVRGAKTCGEGWRKGLRQATAGIVMLGLDDFLPHDGALEAGVDAAERGIYPAPRIVKRDGELESCGTLGGAQHFDECPDGTLSYMSSVPIATSEAWEAIGEPLPIHYYVDDGLGYAVRKAGIPCEVVRDYAFTHLEERHGTHRVVNRAMADRALMLQHVASALVTA
jgi:hypothetical protein